MDRSEIINNLFDNMSVAKRVIHARMRQASAEYPISHTQMELLFIIKHSGAMSFKQLAAHMNLSPGAVSQLVEGLDEQSLVTRTADPNDRRIQMLQLSTEGANFVATIEQQRRQVMEKVVEELTTEELEVWMKIQQKMITTFQGEIQ